MTKKKQSSDNDLPPLWLQTMNPSNYASQWFAKTGLAKKIKTTIAATDLSAATANTSANTPANTIDARQILLPVAKALFIEGREIIKERFLEDNDGAIYVGGYALLMDSLIIALFSRIAGEENKNFCLLATGGYGRQELAPQSDIDLIFLTANKPDKKITQIIETLLYILWDMGLSVGHATRSLSQQLKASKEDLTIRTTLLEGRHIAGDKALFTRLMEKFESDIIAHTAVEFITLKLEERDLRHTKSGNHRYVVEPNIKDGKGGLRDLHTLFWIARYAYRAPSIEAMIAHGVFSTTEVSAFSVAQRFLWSVRCHLHLRAGRHDDRLTFDAQMDIAPLLRFASRPGKSSVERFMRRYYLAAKSVGNLTRIFCAAFAADFVPEPRPFLKKALLNEEAAPFEIDAQRLSLPANFRFRDNPTLMMRMFEIAQETGLDIHPDALRKLHASLALIDTAFRNDAQINASFIAILTSSQSCERILRLMNESGFIGKFLPDFGRIVALMQFDMYHSYTVDEHTIIAMGILNGIETGELAEIAPVATAAVKEIALRKELYVALLLHDIAKGRGGNHSILGAEVARNICPRFGFDVEATETVAWLIEHHLLMSDTAFRYDLNDSETINAFAVKVQSPERLNLLLVLTVADIRAVGSNVWNGWKAALIRTLYARTMAALRGENMDAELGQIVASAKANLHTALARDWSQAASHDHIDMFYDSYWMAFDTDSHRRHGDMFKAHLQSKSPLSISLTPDSQRNATELVIIMDDDAGSFSRIAGGIAALGINIVDARITSRKDGLTLDVLWIQDKDKQAIADKQIFETIRKQLDKALKGTIDIAAATERRNRQTPARIRRIAAPARVLINNNASKTHTVLEINGKDAPGLVYKITRCIAELGLQIQMASVSTYGDRVVDVFYVKDGFGLKITNEARLEKISKELYQVLCESDPANEVAA